MTQHLGKLSYGASSLYSTRCLLCSVYRLVICPYLRHFQRWHASRMADFDRTATQCLCIERRLQRTRQPCFGLGIRVPLLLQTRSFASEQKSHLWLVPSIDGPIVFGLHGREQEHLHDRLKSVSRSASSMNFMTFP